ncbi:MAG: ATP-binding cassette domain-containing protein, partial [Rhodothermales bacterium]|nr:ATP-binding cassette domain-containing protein [Rhodothermales bacterium]
VGLSRAADQEVATYSSGMKQRLKLAMAVIHSPTVLMFDEPSSNLDSAGREVVRTLMETHRDRGRLVLVATNVDDEAALCDRAVNVADFVPSGAG